MIHFFYMNDEEKKIFVLNYRQFMINTNKHLIWKIKWLSLPIQQTTRRRAVQWQWNVRISADVRRIPAVRERALAPAAVPARPALGQAHQPMWLGRIRYVWRYLRTISIFLTRKITNFYTYVLIPFRGFFKSILFIYLFFIILKLLGKILFFFELTHRQRYTLSLTMSVNFTIFIK